MAGRNKKKKTYRYYIELKDGDKNMTISFDEKGDCEILIQSGDSETTFNIPEPLTDSIRLLFWDNHRRLHVWKTRNQRKAERLLEHTQTMQNIEISNDIIFPDISLDILPLTLPDITEQDNKEGK